MHCQPLRDELPRWLEKSQQHVPPKSSLGKAIIYSLNQWSKLNRYLEDGRLHIDNNRAERAIKPFVIGRKNWLFCQYSEWCERQCHAVQHDIKGLISNDEAFYIQ